MITPADLRSALLRLARRMLAGRRLAVMELRNRIVFSRSVRTMRRIEDAEVERLSRGLPQLPQARVATVIATYRRPDLLLRAVNSALEQSVRDHVVIVVDDGGGLTGLLPDDPRLLACSLSANTAVAGLVRNVGIRLTRSTYVAFLDDDNEWERDHLEVALSALEEGDGNERPDVVYTALQRIFPDGSAMDVLSTPFNRRLLAREGYVDTNALVIRRFPQLYFSRMNRPRKVRPREDWELVFRLSRRHRTIHVPIATVRYRVNPDSHWSNWAAAMGQPQPPASDVLRNNLALQACNPSCRHNRLR